MVHFKTQNTLLYVSAIKIAIFCFMLIVSFQAKVFGNFENLAHEKATYQSSYFDDIDSSWEAVDGDITLPENHSHTKIEQSPWWEVDLGSVQDIGQIKIYNRNSEPKSYSEALTNFYIFASKTPLQGKILEASDSLLYHAGGVAKEIEFDVSTQARYVRVQLFQEGYLHMSEVEIYKENYEDSQGLDITSHSPIEITESSAKIRFSGTDYASAYIEYGTTEMYGETTNKELSFKFKDHLQPLDNLQKNTQYYYKIYMVNIQGDTKIVEGNFRTEGELNVTGELGIINLNDGQTISKDQKLEFTYGDTDIIQWIIRTGIDGYSKLYDQSERMNPEINKYTLKGLPESGDVVVNLLYKTTFGSWEAKTYNFTISGDLSSSSSSFSSSSFSNSSGSPEGWPENTNNDLPYAGIFYGINEGGTGIQNAGIGVENSRRFRAERTGNVSWVAYNNRTITDDNITSRCLPADPDSVWCKCIDAGLDKYTCGYTLGSSYSVGNGGRITIELRTDDGKGLPSDTVLGRTKQFIPVDIARETWPKLDLDKEVSLVAGKIYHLVFLNDRPPINCPDLASYTPEEAKECDKDRGAIGLNGSRYWYHGTDAGKFGPYLGDNSSATLFKRSAGSSWRQYATSIAFYEIGYTDGVSTGETTFPYYGNREGTGKNTVEGSKILRQTFTVEDATRKVDGFWLVIGHNDETNGKSLDGILKDSSGEILATTEVKPASQCLESGVNRGFCRDWSYASFGKTISLEKGKKYYMEFSGPSGAGFTVMTFETLVNLGSKNNTEYWNNAKAEYSEDGGKTWGDSSDRYPSLRDVGILFTIEGMPKKIDVDLPNYIR